MVKENEYPYNLPCEHVRFSGKDAVKLDCGMVLDDYNVSYKTYGKLNADKSNAIMIFHALTGDQFVAGKHPVTGKDGWWSRLVGKGKPVDTDKYFVICANILGSCMGTEGPKSINAKTGKRWNLSFPVITIADMIEVQIKLLNHLKIEKLHSIIGPSMGGMLAMYFASKYGDRTDNVIIVASSPQLSPRNIGFSEVARQSIMSDPNWHGGEYLEKGTVPDRGLATARMAAHITYLSESAMYKKFGRDLQNKEQLGYSFIESDFQVENYLKHQGASFVKRFDANSYLYITRAMDYFDTDKTAKSGLLSDAFKDTKNRWCIISISSDWLHPTKNSKKLMHALNGVGADVSFAELQSDAGHDAFLLDEPDFNAMIDGFLNGVK
ncbi:MAG: homoserine O-acetyltransferase MetX [Alphaproteobacteria bacterium]